MKWWHIALGAGAVWLLWPKKAAAAPITGGVVMPSIPAASANALAEAFIPEIIKVAQAKWGKMFVSFDVLFDEKNATWALIGRFTDAEVILADNPNISGLYNDVQQAP